MRPFIGTYSHAIDAKHRLAIPSTVRSQVREQLGLSKDDHEKVYWYVTLGEGDCLCLYTEARFEQLASDLDRSERDVSELIPYENVMFSLSDRVEMDKAGRVRLPESLIDLAQLGTQVTLIGVKDHLEIHDHDRWQAYLETALKDRRRIVMNPRRAMKASPPDPGRPEGEQG